jgi:hypothetical protein
LILSNNKEKVILEQQNQLCWPPFFFWIGKQNTNRSCFPGPMKHTLSSILAGIKVESNHLFHFKKVQSYIHTWHQILSLPPYCCLLHTRFHKWLHTRWPTKPCTPTPIDYLFFIIKILTSAFEILVKELYIVNIFLNLCSLIFKNIKYCF